MIDTHCHLDDPVYEADFDTVLAAQQAAGVERILVPGVDADNAQAVLDVCRRSHGYLLPAIGLHPENIHADWQDQLDRLHQLLTIPLAPYIAIGEIGLDYHADLTYKEEQKQAFITQLEWAQEQDLPVMIHCREATQDCLDLLRHTRLKKPLHGVMHCFSGSNEVARQIVDMGLYLGIGGVITFKNCLLREHLGNIPIERIVLETDAPYMTPVPYRGKRNESRFIQYVIEALSTVYGLPTDEIDRITSQNARCLFRLKDEK